jgi:YtkA-like
MKNRLWGRMLMAALLTATPALAKANPLKVGTAGGDSQIVIMCPDCGAPIACAKVGDYALVFSADLEDPKLGLARLTIRVTDKSGAPVNGLKVVVTLSMREHKHALRPMAATSLFGKGEYWVSTGQLQMDGVWNAEVAVTTPKGDTVKQVFTFRK